MRRTCCICAFIFLVIYSGAQSTAGITGIRDTSYSIANEYARQVKNYSFIQQVSEIHSEQVVEEKDIIYSKTKERELKLDVFYPRGKSVKKRIAILFIHGGGWRTGNKTMHYPLLQRLAA